MRPRHAVLLTPSNLCAFARFLREESSHPTQLLSRRHSVRVSPLAATLMDLPASVANKRLTVGLSPLDATLTKNRGVHPSSQRALSLRAFPAVRTFKRFDVQTFQRVSQPSPFLSIIYALSYTTGDTYLLFFQSLAHSFHRDGGCTPPLPTLELTPCVSPGLPAPLYLLFSYSYVEPILQALYFLFHPFNGGCTLLPGVSTGYRLLPIITYPQGFSASKKSKKMSQLRAVWRLFALVEEPGASGSAGSGISVRSVPRFAVNRLDRFQLFLRKRLIHCGK